jgi:hypothetical protein
MARLNINLGTTANDRTGDPLRTAFEKVNANFIELYAGGGLENQLTNGSNTVTLNTAGALSYPNSALQRDTDTVTCAGNASTVVYTGSSQFQHTIRLLIQVEGSESSGGWDTQSSEMIVAKSFKGDNVASSVYGIVYTSVAPLATFTADWNALTSRVEILCTPAGANQVSVKIFATEITTSD